MRIMIRTELPHIKKLKLVDRISRTFRGKSVTIAQQVNIVQKRPEGARLAYNLGFDFSLREEEHMEAERINSLSALLADMTTREAELRRYL
jgi:hypothetical protein